MYKQKYFLFIIMINVRFEYRSTLMPKGTDKRIKRRKPTEVEYSPLNCESNKYQYIYFKFSLIHCSPRWS